MRQAASLPPSGPHLPEAARGASAPSSVEAQVSPTALLDWRRQAFEILMRATFVVLSAPFAFILHDELTHDRPSVLLYLWPSWVVIAVAVFARRMPLGMRQAVVITAFLVAFAANTYRLAFLVPNGFVAAAMLVLLAALFLSRRAAWLVWSCTVMVVIGCALVYTQGHRPRGFDSPLLDLAIPANWARVVVIYGVISAAATFGLSALSRRIEAAGRLSESLLATVQAQGQKRLASMEQLAEVERQLGEAQGREAVGTLAGGVAHDFNNLLVVILNNAEELQHALEEPELRRASAAIAESGRRAADLSRQLLDYSRARAPGNCELDVRHGTERALELLGRLLPATVRLQTDIAPDLPKVWGPPSAIEQILVNLCLNGAEAMPGGGTLSVTVMRSESAQQAQGGGEHLCIRVDDAGGGMPSGTMRRAFEPLFTTKDRSTHAGLGLSIVADLAKRAGGGVSCRRLGDGMRFEVHLAPVGVDPQRASGAPATQVDAGGLLGAGRAVGRGRARTAVWSVSP